jgi:carboxyl-terminal processing protease
MIQNLEPSEIEEVFLTTFTQMYDPHSNFLSADSMEEFAIAMHNSLVGIGAVLAEEDGVCTIKELLPGGPAEKSDQLNPNDKIVGVAQGNGPMVDVMGLKLRAIVKKIRGKKGTEVRLLIWPAGSDPSKRKIVTLIRDEIKLTTNLAEAQLFDIDFDGSTLKIGVVDLPTFYGSGDPSSNDPSTTRDVKELIEKLKAKGMEGLILDLRRNGGGLLSEAISLTGLFISTGPVVQVKNTIGQLNEYVDSDPEVTWSGPLIVLVSRYSASASEIVAGALKTSNRAIIVGDESTHGKGTVQAIFEIDRSVLARLTQPKMGAAKITIQKWYLPDGNSTQLKGVQSDIVLPSMSPYLSIGESELPNALEWDSIRPLPWRTEDFGLITQSTKQELDLRSKQRQAQLEEFVYLNESIDWFKEKKDQKEFSLNYYRRQIDKDLNEKFQEEREKKLDELSKRRFKNEHIYLDSRIKNETNSHREKAEEINEDDEKLDIHLRESLRIMADWIEMLKHIKLNDNAA